MHEGRPAVAVREIGRSPEPQQGSHRLVVAAGRRPHESGLAVAVDLVGFEPRLEQCLHHQPLAAGGGGLEGRLVLPRGEPERCFRLHQRAHDVDVPGLRRELQRPPADLGLADIGARLDQRAHERVAAPLRGEAERARLLRQRVQGRLLRRPDDGARRGQRALPGREHEGRPALVVRDVHVRARRDEVQGEDRLLPPRRLHQCRPAVLIAGVEAGPGLDQGADDGALSAANGQQESRALGAVTRVDVRARLELRPDLADVALLRGGDKRVLRLLDRLLARLLGSVVGEEESGGEEQRGGQEDAGSPPGPDDPRPHREDGSASSGPDHPRPSPSGTLVAVLRRPRADPGGRALHHPARAGPRHDGRRVRGRGHGPGSHRRRQDHRARLRAHGRGSQRVRAALLHRGAGRGPALPIRASSSVTTSARTRRAESSSSSSNT